MNSPKIGQCYTTFRCTQYFQQTVEKSTNLQTEMNVITINIVIIIEPTCLWSCVSL